MHERPRYYSPFHPPQNPFLPTRWSDHLSMQTPGRIKSLETRYPRTRPFSASPSNLKLHFVRSPEAVAGPFPA